MEKDYDKIDDMSQYDTPFYMRDIDRFMECFGLTPDDLKSEDYL